MTTASPRPRVQHAAGVARLATAAALLGVLMYRVTHQPAEGPHEPRDPGFLVDVNHADEDTLQLLPGLGPSIAANVVARRETAGPFRRLEDLEEVRMIGSVLRERMSPWVTLGDRVGDFLPDAAQPPAP